MLLFYFMANVVNARPFAYWWDVFLETHNNRQQKIQTSYSWCYYFK